MKMKLLLVVHIAFVLVSDSNAQKLPKCGKSHFGIGTVISGRPSTPHSWPWLVAFFFKPENQFFCGGSLISAKHVLSGKWKQQRLLVFWRIQ
jgi:hypothetical protein